MELNIQPPLKTTKFASNIFILSGNFFDRCIPIPADVIMIFNLMFSIKNIQYDTSLIIVLN